VLSNVDNALRTPGPDHGVLRDQGPLVFLAVF
jgi:hypothetical protein